MATININNGTGTGNLINDTYTVTSSITGYDNTSIDPASVDIVSGTNTYNFTVSATGTLTLHVTETGEAAGTPIVGATFVRTDSAGNTYGTTITTDASGDAIFNNVPFAAENAPLVYYKQTASDGSHEFDSTVQSTFLTTSTSTVQITNTVGALRTINLTDTNYANLPIDTGTITLAN